MSIPPEISKWLEQSQITPVECCGHGGYGEIWLVKAPFGQNWALKIIDKTKLEPSAWEREVRAVQKYRAAIGLELNLIYVQQAGDLDDYFFYLMETADNRLLALFGQPAKDWLMFSDTGNFVLILLTNWIVKRHQPEMALF